jgi:dTDP-4-amino-4,6-dideoxygalactose transaminase
MIPFNRPSITQIENKYVMQALSSKLSGDATFTKLAYKLFFEKTGVSNMLLTTSCTHALELSALLSELKTGDEVIIPSFTFVSTINAFLLRGVHPVFCEIDPKTMNIDVNKIEDLLNPKIKAIVAVHYAGVCCDMDAINNIAKRQNLIVIEDAAQAVGSKFKGRPAGTLSDYGCYSFHETKNYVMGEGGALIVNNNNEKFKQAEIIREKGTDRSRYLRGEVDKYTWQSVGSSYLPSDVLAAILCGQLERFEEIMEKRIKIWKLFYDGVEILEKEGKLKRQFIPEYTTHNAHMFFLLANTSKERDYLIYKLKEKGIQSTFHYVPLHSSPMGSRLGYRKEDLPITEEYSGRLIRLPLWPELSIFDVEFILENLIKIY